MKAPIYHRKFNFRKSLLPNDHLASLEEGVQDIESAKSNTGLSVGYPGWNLLYYITLCSLDRESENIIIETGSNVGCSTIILCQALKDSGYSRHVYSVEIDTDIHSVADANIGKAGLSDLVTLAVGDSVDFLTDFVQKIENIRLAFLDGCHEEEHVVREFDLIYPKLSNSSVVFF